ncbi:MAG: DNA repair protein RecO [Alphaproteobacteria bacterium]|nr:MAG: DNA repair protein RecO [Alphaproteobacteria bacterium]
MEQWEDRGVVVSVRPHGENAAVVTLLTENHGRWAGYVHGGQGSKHRGTLQIGNMVTAEWQARVSDGLGQYKLELERPWPSLVFDNRRKLLALQAACAVADQTLPEREPCPAVTAGMDAFLETLLAEEDVFLPAYIYWETGLLRALGFGLDLSCCALTGEEENLAYISPRTGRAATAAAAAVYKDKLLPLPSFLCGGKDWTEEDICDGLNLTGHFLRHRVFAATHRDLPEPRLRFANAVAPKPEEEAVTA